MSRAMIAFGGCAVCILAAMIVAQPASASELPEGWTFRKSGEPFSARWDAITDDAGRPVSALVLSFPAHTVSQTGWFAGLSANLRLPTRGPVRLCLTISDTFDGPTRGYHYVSVLIGGKLFFQADVAEQTGERALEIDLGEYQVGGEVSIELRLEERAGVTNFPVEVLFGALRLKTSEGVRDLLPPPTVGDYAPLPPDPPISGPSLVGTEWTRSACVLQPWGASQWEIIVHAEERIPWLAEQFGFNAVILLPPAAHNTITRQEHHLTDEQFVQALSLFRRYGFRFILYSSIMHCGHAPEWMDGTLQREHPEWSQRGPAGEPVTVYGHEWLCPSTGALDYTIAYTRGLVEAYEADAVMLDNNEFFRVPSGLTCYCAGCQAAFRRYVQVRFGNTFLGISTDKIAIPTEPGPLCGVWLHWRNRVWAEANEAFRREFARVRPGTVLLANTQYLYSGPALASDLQYEHEDAILSESRDQDLHGMTAKLLLGQALACGRPLWNYLGTFREDDYTRLRSADEVGMNVSVTFATGARPWIVYYGFTEHPDDEANREALNRLAATLRWHLENEPAHRGLRPFAPVLALISHRSRNLRGDAIQPKCLFALRRQGVPVQLVEERHLSDQTLRSARVLLIESASCLDEQKARVIARWVRSGGQLYTAPVAGMYDELGRLRARSVLLKALGLSSFPSNAVPVGKGAVANLGALASSEGVAPALEQFRFRTSPPADVEFLPYLTAAGKLFVYVCAQGPLPENLVVYAPSGWQGEAVICAGGSAPRVGYSLREG